MSAVTRSTWRFFSSRYGFSTSATPRGRCFELRLFGRFYIFLDVGRLL